MDRRWRKGIFVGILKGSDEAVVMTPEGSRKARSIRIVVEKQRYDQELVNQAVGPARIEMHGGDDVESPRKESQQSSGQAPSASNPAPMQQDEPAAALPANESVQVEQTVESPVQAENARGLKRAGGDIRDIDPDGWFAMHTDVTQAWTMARAQVYTQSPSGLKTLRL